MATVNTENGESSKATKMVKTTHVERDTSVATIRAERDAAVASIHAATPQTPSTADNPIQGPKS